MLRTSESAMSARPFICHPEIYWSCGTLPAMPIPHACVQLDWAKRAGIELRESESTYEDKKDYHQLLRKKLGIPLKR
jgi:hypothetical protein